jgi:hypothetical protein
LHVLLQIAVGAASAVALGVLVVAFLQPGKQREKIERLASTFLFVAMLCFFLNLLRQAIAADSELRMIVFGFLSAMFGCGLVLSSVRTIRALAGRVADEKTSATH